MNPETEAKPQHTALRLKWKNDPYESGVPYITITAGREIYPEGFCIKGILSEADAAFICKAANEREALVKALMVAHNYMVPNEKTVYAIDEQIVSQALAKAEAI